MHQIKLGMIFIVICVYCMGLTSCSKSEKSGPYQQALQKPQISETEEELKTFFSQTIKDDCILCGDRKGTMFSMYQGQKNLGIISLNTFDIAYIGINQYNDDGILIEKPVEHSSTTIRTSKESGYSAMVSENPDRGYATGSITFYQNSSLDLKKVTQYLCSDCINSMLDTSWSENPYGIGLIDFYEKKIRLFEKHISAFEFGDYYVSCDYRSEEKTEYQNMDFLIFYCPERYQ
mgnify:CR=1 FL=1